jgi:hypothetical protein
MNKWPTPSHHPKKLFIWSFGHLAIVSPHEMAKWPTEQMANFARSRGRISGHEATKPRSSQSVITKTRRLTKVPVAAMNEMARWPNEQMANFTNSPAGF